MPSSISSRSVGRYRRSRSRTGSRTRRQRRPRSRSRSLSRSPRQSFSPASRLGLQKKASATTQNTHVFTHLHTRLALSDYVTAISDLRFSFTDLVTPLSVNGSMMTPSFPWVPRNAFFHQESSAVRS
ncbi:hypothetical protein T4A_13516 [Trichinella pseudospiralis]|uniref:Uncharacterized protein n=1 Tax=Trichinella pseudospiralis TaxID=6337 RepID=A0A0V1EQY7_TRIPS|nr:hypothetical protein T4A_13516 [Trichinella pseudospiralis]